MRFDSMVCMDIALHPKFADNKLVYLAYSKVGPNLAPGAEPLAARLGNLSPAGAMGKTTTTRCGARGGTATRSSTARTSSWATTGWTTASRRPTPRGIVFGRDGMLYMGIGAPNAPGDLGQVRALQGRPRAGPRQPRREIPALERRRNGAERQPVRRQGRLQAGDLHDGAPQHARAGRPSRSPARSGKTRMDRRTATRSTSSKPDRTTAGRSSATDATTRVTSSADSAPLARPAGADACQVMTLPGMEPPVSFWAPAVAPSGHGVLYRRQVSGVEGPACSSA